MEFFAKKYNLSKKADAPVGALSRGMLRDKFLTGVRIAAVLIAINAVSPAISQEKPVEPSRIEKLEKLKQEFDKVQVQQDSLGLKKDSIASEMEKIGGKAPREEIGFVEMIGLMALSILGLNVAGAILGLLMEGADKLGILKSSKPPYKSNWMW